MDMKRRLYLFAALGVLAVLAFAGALVQAAAGERPALFAR
jgi:hypothetical protein